MPFFISKLNGSTVCRSNDCAIKDGPWEGVISSEFLRIDSEHLLNPLSEN